MEKLLENLPSATQERFEGLLARQSFAAVEEAWMEELASAGDAGPGDPSPFLSTADALIASGEKDRAGVLLELLLPAYQRTGGAPARLQALRRLIVLSPRRSDLRGGFAACYREIHGEEALPELCLSISGVEASAEPVKALTVLDRLLAFRPGSCVYHASGWGV